jgi:hypothetical protein
MSLRGEPDISKHLKAVGERNHFQFDYNPATGKIVMQSWLETVYPPAEFDAAEFLAATGLTLEDCQKVFARKDTPALDLGDHGDMGEEE